MLVVLEVLELLDVLDVVDVVDEGERFDGEPQLELAAPSAVRAAERAPSTRCWPDATAWRAGPNATEVEGPPPEPDERPLVPLDAVDELLDADDDPLEVSLEDPLVGVDTPFRALLRVS